MKTILLAVVLSCTIFVPNHSESGTEDTYQTVEHNEVRVTFLEMAQRQSPNGKHVSTSFLFMVENTSTTDGTNSHSAPVRLYDEENNLLFNDASNGLPKTSSTLLNYQNRPDTELPAHVEPTDIERTHFVRHSIATSLPKNVAFIEADFGLDGTNRTFRFNLHQPE